MNRISSLAIATLAASAALFSGASFAQASTDAPAGKTRAEVIAETKAALRNGEIGDGHEWAMYQPLTTARQVPVKLATTSTTSNPSTTRATR